MISAVILIEAEPVHVTDLAEQLVELDGVAEAYSVTGEYDLVAILRVKEQDELAKVVTNGIAKLTGVQRTHTLVAFKVYRAADYDWEVS